MSETRYRKAANALAEAWASIDGKLVEYERERGLSVSESFDLPGFTGTFEGYLAEAEEMIRRLRSRGFDVTPISPSLRASAS